MSDSKPKVIKDYPSWGDYRAEVGKIKASAHQGDRDWCGTDTIGEAIQIADIGWPDGMARVQAIALPALSACHSALHADGGWAYDVTGADYDVGEYLSGTPECWLTPQAIESRPTITIGANIVSSAGIPKEALERRGAAVCALIMALQAAGYAVRAFAVEGMATNGKEVWHRVCLTDDNGGPLDTDRILFALAHPSAARQIGYCLGVVLAGADPSSGNFIGWPAGGSTANAPWDFDLYLEPPYINAAQWADQDSVNRWVEDTYKALSEGHSSK